jgi:hypothetical protein
MDQLQKDIAQLVARDAEDERDPAETFYSVKELAHGRDPESFVCSLPLERNRAPRLTESWFC